MLGLNLKFQCFNHLLHDPLSWNVLAAAFEHLGACAIHTVTGTKICPSLIFSVGLERDPKTQESGLFFFFPFIYVMVIW